MPGPPEDPFCAVSGYRPSGFLAPGVRPQSVPLKDNVQQRAAEIYAADNAADVASGTSEIDDIEQQLQRSKQLTAYYNLAKDAFDAGIPGTLIPTLSPTADSVAILAMTKQLRRVMSKYGKDPVTVV